ncbi:hypothetical protein BS78_01G099800 [Paspalum vaginatum]|nr:hypothetical protein BS78_01G099800 [Paspalum vaginatum]
MGVALPDDALAEILRRLPPRSLATSRCVCKAWQAIVDGRRLLLPELLPHSVRGIFLMHNELRYPAFLAHPSMEPEIFDNLNFNRHADAADGYWGSRATVLGHCNGLLLYEDMEGFHVVNPATLPHESLPPPPPVWRFWWGSHHLVFDPSESLHYEVFFVPRAPERDAPSLEWPASTWVLCVFSSRTGQWEERAFVREDEAAGMASDKEMQRRKPLWQRCSVYWQGVLFVPCNASFTVMRISLSNNKYRVIKMPTDIGDSEYGVCLGRSKEGLCSASFHDWYKLRVWILDESCGAMEWVLKHHIDIHHSVSRLMWHCEEKEGPWKLQDAENEDYDQESLQYVNYDEDDSNNALIKGKVEWDSDNDNIVDNESEFVECFLGDITVLGFHPYKDVIFLNLSLQRAVAYHLSTSMVQDLGKVSPDYYGGHAAYIKSSFPYTPCLMAEFPENKQEAHVEG